MDAMKLLLKPKSTLFFFHQNETIVFLMKDDENSFNDETKVSG